MGVSSACNTLSVTGIELVVVHITGGTGAGVCIFGRLIGEYLKKNNTIFQKNTPAGGSLNNFQELQTKFLEDNKIDLNDYNNLKQPYNVYQNNKTKLNSEFIF